MRGARIAAAMHTGPRESVTLSHARRSSRLSVRQKEREVGRNEDEVEGNAESRRRKVKNGKKGQLGREHRVARVAE